MFGYLLGHVPLDLKVITMNEFPNDFVMKFDGLGEADGSARQALESSSKGQVLPLNTLGRAFGDEMLLGGK